MSGPVNRHTPRPPRHLDLSMRIDKYDESEDDDMDEFTNQNGLCSDCRQPDTGYCFCTEVENYALMNGITVEEQLCKYHAENERLDRARAARQALRLVRKRILAWQRAVRVHRLISYWRKAAAAPDSKAYQRAAKRFKANSYVS